MSTIESRSLRKRQTILVDKQRQPQGPRINQSFASRDTGRRRVTSGHTHARNFSRQVSSNLDTLSETHAASATDLAGDPLNDDILRHGGDTDRFVVTALAGASADEIRQFRERLKNNYDEAVEREQHTLRTNYESMKSVSRSIAQISSGVGELRKQVGELQVVSDAIRQDAVSALDRSNLTRRSRPISGSSSNLLAEKLGDDSAAFIPGDRRQSMLMLNNAWAQDLLRLFNRVEGAQKYLPAVPGRHVVLESPAWQELNLVTLKPVKACVMFLLNDHLLVATPKPRLVVDRCWPLSKISVDNTDKSIRVWASDGNTQAPRTFRASSTHSLNQFLEDFYKTKEQYVAINQAQIQAQGHGDLSRHGSAAQSQADLRRDGSKAKHSRSLSAGSIGHNDASVAEQRDALRVVADIDRDIAHRQYSSAVEMCLENSTHRLIVDAITERKNKLSDILLDQLRTSESTTRMSKQEKVQVIGLLIKLGLAKQARQTFLDSVTTAISERSRQIQFVRDIVSYISQMAVVYFQMIKAAVEVYQQAFPSYEESSIIVTWAKGQVDLYAGVFERQLHRIGPRSRSYHQCIDVSRRESSQLQDLAMDMDFMLHYAWSK